MLSRHLQVSIQDILKYCESPVFRPKNDVASSFTLFSEPHKQEMFWEGLPDYFLLAKEGKKGLMGNVVLTVLFVVVQINGVLPLFQFVSLRHMQPHLTFGWLTVFL